MADRKGSDVAVIGLGRMGSALARALVQRGIPVLAIDADPEVVQSLSSELPHVVIADATDIEVLRELEIDRYRRAVVAIGEHLEASVLATSLLSELEIPAIWAKATTVQHGRVLERMGAHHVVHPEQDAGERLSHLIADNIQDYVELDRGYAFIKTAVPGHVVDKTLGEAGIRHRFGVTVVAIKKTNGEFTYATAQTRLDAGDTLIVAGPTRAVETFASAL